MFRACPLGLFLFAVTARAQPEGWAESIRASERLEREGGFEQSLAALEVALRQADGNPQNQAYTWNNFGSVRQEAGQYAGAEEAYLRSLSIWYRCCRANPGLARTQNNLASLYVGLGQFTRARKLLEASLEAHRKLVGSEDLETARVEHNLAAVLVECGRASEAVGLYRHALAAREAALGSGHPETTATRIALAVAQARCGRMIEARDLLERAVLACSARACPAALQADLWTNLGSLYSLDGKPGRAEPLLRRALKRLEELVPPLDPRLVPVLLNRAITLRALRRAGEARRLEARARDIRRREARDNPLAGVLDASARAR